MKFDILKIFKCKSKQKKLKIIGIVLMFFGILVLWVLYQAFGESSPIQFENPKYIEIPVGSTTYNVAKILVSEKLIYHPRLFIVLARITGFDRKLRAGYFKFEYRPSVWEVIRKLTSGGSFDVKLTIPEAYTIYEIGSLVQCEFKIDSLQFVTACSDTKVFRKLNISALSMEGFLFPETYLVPKDIKSESLIVLMYNEFQRRWRPEWDIRLDEIEFSKLDIVILASIIEAEAHVKNEQKQISSVYHNRLSKGMLLQADPTVAYGMGKINQPLLIKDLKSPSVYNTYIHSGLPAGPICNPGEDAIIAALYPETTSYLYFVSRRADGTHKFSRTFIEHNKAIQEIKRNLRNN